MSDEPEFTWAGTMYVVLAPAVLGVLVEAVVAVGHRRWARRSLRAVLALLSLSLGVGAGALFYPTLALGTIAYATRSRTPTRATLRLIAAVAAIGLPVALLGSTIGGGDDPPTAWHLAVGAIAYLTICLISVVLFGRAWGRSAVSLPRAAARRAQPTPG